MRSGVSAWRLPADRRQAAEAVGSLQTDRQRYIIEGILIASREMYERGEVAPRTRLVVHGYRPFGGPSLVEAEFVAADDVPYEDSLGRTERPPIHSSPSVSDILAGRRPSSVMLENVYAFQVQPAPGVLIGQGYFGVLEARRTYQDSLKRSVIKLSDPERSISIRWESLPNVDWREDVAEVLATIERLGLEKIVEREERPTCLAQTPITARGWEGEEPARA